MSLKLMEAWLKSHQKWKLVEKVFIEVFHKKEKLDFQHLLMPLKLVDWNLNFILRIKSVVDIMVCRNRNLQKSARDVNEQRITDYVTYELKVNGIQAWIYWQNAGLLFYP